MSREDKKGYDNWLNEVIDESAKWIPTPTPKELKDELTELARERGNPDYIKVWIDKFNELERKPDHERGEKLLRQSKVLITLLKNQSLPPK